MDDSLGLLEYSHKLQTLLQERRNVNQEHSVHGIQEHHDPTNNLPDKNGQLNDINEDLSKEGEAERNPEISFKTFPIHSNKPFGDPINNYNGDTTPDPEMSIVDKTGHSETSDGKKEKRISFTADIPYITPPLSGEDSRMRKPIKFAEPPKTNGAAIGVPEILIWPDTDVEDDFSIDIEESLPPTPPEASSPTSSSPSPPPPPPRFENLESSPQFEKENEKEPISNGHIGERFDPLENNEIGKNDIKTEGDITPLPMDSAASTTDESNMNDDDEGEQTLEERKCLLRSGKAPIRRRSISSDDTKPAEKKPLVSILHRRGENTAVGPRMETNDLNAEHPTMGQSLNSLAHQALQEQNVADEEKGLGSDLHFHDNKKRRSFCDLLLEIPRKLSNVSDDLANVGPMLKRGLANRKARKHSQDVKEKKEVEKDKSLKDCFFILLSGMYGLIIVVLGAVIPISETFAGPETLPFFDGFYIYLFTCSGLFILYVYTFLLRRNKKNAGFRSALNRTFIRSWSFTAKPEKDLDRDDSWYRRKTTTDLGPHNPNGSFYLRLGALGFGIGGMIHSGLLLGVHFQAIGGNTNCDSRIQAVKPLFHLIFTFSQLYFVFLNPKVCIHRYKTFARFGLMHMCGTNICVWFRNIVVETLHEMHRESHDGGYHLDGHAIDTHHLNKAHGPKNLTHNLTHHVTHHIPNHGHILVENITHKPLHDKAVPAFNCYWNEMMGQVVDRASPYLYPCSIEYSLICAGIMYVLWQQVGRGAILVRVDCKEEDRENQDQLRHNRMSVDCGSSSRGLFVGILLFVMAVISMVAFYVLVNKENMTITALALVHLSEITIYLLGIIATLAAAWRMRNLAYHPGHASVLENVLIFISLTGVFIFCIFGIIAAIFHRESGLANVLSIASNLMMIIQSIIQTVFMVVASELQAFTAQGVKKKLGREFVTFLILCNLSLWGINTFETQRTEHNPIQTDFYGHMPWAILTHISVPLGIFYRFHSTVCLSNIWKNAWKNKKPL